MSWVSDAWDSATDSIGDAWEETKDFAGDVWQETISFSTLGFNTLAYDYTSDAIKDWIEGQLSDLEERYEGTLINKQSNVAPLPVLYGQNRIGGVRAGVFTTGSDNKYLHLVLALCEGPIEAIDTVYIDNTPASDEKYDGLVRVKRHLGADDQEADDDLVSEVDQWTTDHRLRGVAYVYLRLEWDKDVFSGIPTILCDVRGRQVYDPRTDSTAYSYNPAVCIYDYLTDSRYGKGLGDSDLDVQSFEDAADYCDEEITLNDNGLTGPRYTCDGVLDTGKTLLQNVKELLSSCNGWLLQADGRYRLTIDKPASAAAHFDEDDIYGPLEFGDGDRRSRKNRMKVRFRNPENNWRPDELPIDVPDYRSTDNGKLLEGSLDLPFTSDPYRVEMMGELAIKQSRFGLSLSVPTSLAALDRLPGDVIELSHDTPGWDHRPFRVVGMTLTPSGTVALKLREYDADVYSLETPAEYTPPPDVDLPDGTTVAPPQNLQVESGEDQLYKKKDGTIVTRARVSWDPPDDAFVYGYRLQYRRSSASNWQDASPPDATSTEAYIWDVEDGVEYDFRLSAENILQASSSWATITDHEIIGKSEPPPAVSELRVKQNGAVTNIKWKRVDVVDIKGYDLRISEETVDNWSAAQTLDEVQAGENITTAQVPPGRWRIYIKARDTSGNLSPEATTARVQVKTPLNVIAREQQHPDWLGLRNHLIRHPSGVLVPQSQSRADELGWEVFDEFVPDPHQDCWYAAPTIDIDFDDDPRVWAEIDGQSGPGEEDAPNPDLYLVAHADGETYAPAFDDEIFGGDSASDFDDEVYGGDSASDFDDEVYGGSATIDWEAWVIGDSDDQRYYRHRVVVPTDGAGIPYLKEFTAVVDQDERTVESDPVQIASEGSTYTFTPPFHAKPRVEVRLAEGESQALIPTYSNVTPESVDVQVLDTSGNGVSAYVIIKARGV